MAVLAVDFALDLGARAAVSENAHLVAWESEDCTKHVFLKKARKSSFLLIPKSTGKVKLGSFGHNKPSVRILFSVFVISLYFNRNMESCCG